MPNDMRAVRLIDAELLRDKLRPLDGKATLSSEWTLTGRDIEQAPTVDAVPVVRCKDCQDFERCHPYGGYCYHWDYEDGSSPNSVDNDDFCSYGNVRSEGK